MAKASEAQLRAQYKIDNDPARTKQIRLKLNRNTDKDVIAKLESVDNMQGYIKSLIREDIKSSEK